MSFNDTQATTDSTMNTMARRGSGRAATPTIAGATLIVTAGDLDHVEHLVALRDSVKGHDTRYAGIRNGRHITLFDTPVRCARAVWCALMADGGWLRLSKYTADFRSRHHRGYRAREIRYALDKMTSRDVLERRRTRHGYEWRATPQTIANWNQINWVAIERGGDK
jgi:hypothetical protein